MKRNVLSDNKIEGGTFSFGIKFTFLEFFKFLSSFRFCVKKCIVGHETRVSKSNNAWNYIAWSLKINHTRHC